MIDISIFILIPFIPINAHDIILPYPTDLSRPLELLQLDPHLGLRGHLLALQDIQGLRCRLGISRDHGWDEASIFTKCLEKKT